MPEMRLAERQAIRLMSTPDQLSPPAPAANEFVSASGSGFERCPRCHAAANEQDMPYIAFQCGTSIAPWANNRVDVGNCCHIPNPDSTISSLYDHEVSQWRWRKSPVIAKEILSWEKHMQRHSQAYAIGGASKTPPGVLPDGDKLSALKEAYKQAKDREDYNALVETHFIPPPAKPSRHATRRHLRR
jgi:hypothetical protein